MSDGNKLYESGKHLLLLPLHVNTSPSFSDITWIFHYFTPPFLSMQLTDAKCLTLNVAICIGNGQWHQIGQVPIDVRIPFMPVET